MRVVYSMIRIIHHASLGSYQHVNTKKCPQGIRKKQDCNILTPKISQVFLCLNFHFPQKLLSKILSPLGDYFINSHNLIS